MLYLDGIGQLLWDDVEVRKRLEPGFQGLIHTVDSCSVAPMDNDHCWLNRIILKPFINRMREQKECALPPKPQISDQLKFLMSRWQKRTDVTEDIDSLDAYVLYEKLESQLFCACCSVKRLLRHLKRAFTRSHIPRDWVSGVRGTFP